MGQIPRSTERISSFLTFQNSICYVYRLSFVHVVKLRSMSHMTAGRIRPSRNFMLLSKVVDLCLILTRLSITQACLLLEYLQHSVSRSRYNYVQTGRRRQYLSACFAVVDNRRGLSVTPWCIHVAFIFSNLHSSTAECQQRGHSIACRPAIGYMVDCCICTECPSRPGSVLLCSWTMTAQKSVA